MGLPIEGQGGELLQIDAKHRAVRASLRPLDVGANGAFRFSAISGSIAATVAANSPLFSLRWTDATKKLVLTELAVSILVDGTITASVAMALEAVIARAFSVVDSGGSALTIATNNGKMDVGHASSLVNDLRIASTAMLTAGTRTLDAQGIGHAVGVSGTTAPVLAMSKQHLYNPLPGQGHPVVLGQNEGLIIRNMLTGPATGTFRLLVDIAWSEVASFGNAAL